MIIIWEYQEILVILSSYQDEPAINNDVNVVDFSFNNDTSL